MAKFKMPFMHRLTQSMADNTYVRSKGKNIIKTKIDQNLSNSKKQQIQRLRMKTVVPLCKTFNTVIHEGFPERPIDFTPWNAFIHANLPAITVSDTMEASIDYQKLLVAQGSLEMVEDVQVVKDAEEHTLTVTHSGDTYGYGSNADDMLQAVVFEPAKRRSKVFPLNERQDETPATITIPTTWDMEQLQVYVFIQSVSGRKVSNSEWVEVK